MAQEGEQLFMSPLTKCSTCHLGPAFTDGLPHDVIAASIDSDAVLAEVITPRLVGLSGRAGFFHDGSAETLTAVIEDNPGDRHGTTSTLTPQQRSALIAYLSGL
jgi:cytochrome c peroxidase